MIGMTHPSKVELAAARLSLGSSAIFILLLGSLHLLEPEFDLTWRFISEYALGRFGWMMPLAFLALAIILACAGVAILPGVRNIPGYIGVLILLVAVIGLVIAASFQTDPITTKMDDLTPGGQMHVLGASLDYSPLAFLLLTFSLIRNPAWSAIRMRLFITAIIPIALTIAFILAIPADAVFGPGVYTGLIGRFLVLSYTGWVSAVAFHILASGRG